MSQEWGGRVCRHSPQGSPIPVVLASRPDPGTWPGSSEVPPFQTLQTAQQSLKSDTPRRGIGFGSPERNAEPFPGSDQAATRWVCQKRNFSTLRVSVPGPPADAPHQTRSDFRPRSLKAPDFLSDASGRSRPSAPTWLGSLAHKPALRGHFPTEQFQH